MPLYDFVCEECGHEFEHFKRLSERTDPVECPECGELGKRVLSGFAVGGSSTSSSATVGAASSGGGCGWSGG